MVSREACPPIPEKRTFSYRTFRTVLQFCLHWK